MFVWCHKKIKINGGRNMVKLKLGEKTTRLSNLKAK